MSERERGREREREREREGEREGETERDGERGREKMGVKSKYHLRFSKQSPVDADI